MKQILILGAKGAGKSTLIQRLLADLPHIRPHGFVTKREPPDAEGFCQVYIHPAADAVADWQRTEHNRIGACRDRRGQAKAETFDGYGVELLSDIPAGAPVVMDELGFFETEAHAFRKRVMELFSSDAVVIAAVKDKPTDFLDEVLRHENATVYRIDAENRDALYETLRAELAPLFAGR